MWQRFTERARRIIFFSQEEATALGENLVSTEHLLLGLLHEPDCVASWILRKLGTDLADLFTVLHGQLTCEYRALHVIERLPVVCIVDNWIRVEE